MRTKASKTRSWSRLFFKLFFLVAITTAIVVPAFTIWEFCEHVKKFNFYLNTGDSVGTKKELGQLHYFYALSGKWKIQWLADRYLFRGAPFYEAADLYLIGDWEKVKTRLKDKLDDPKSYLYGAAKFRQAQAEYRATRKIEAPLNFVMTEVRQDFERDLRNCLKGSDYLKCWDRVYNFDMAGNKKDAEEALKQPKMSEEFMLGPLKEEEDGPGKPPGNFPLGKKLEEKQPGSSDPKRRP